MIAVAAKCPANAFRHTSTHLSTYLYHGQGTSVDYRDLTKYDVVFTTYETVLSDANRSSILQTIFWFRIVLDEGTKY